MLFETFFEITDDRYPFDAFTAVDEDKEITSPDHRYRRNDVLRDRIGMKLFVNDDPHFDPMPLHHRQEHAAEPLFQPLLANVHLLPLGQKRRHRRYRFV